MKGGNYLNGTTMLILVCGSMLAILGLISAASHMYNLNGIKSKTVGDGQHGAARFATGQELLRTFNKVPYNPDYWRELGPKSTDLNLPQGVIVGCKNKSSLVFQPGRKWPFRIRRQTYALVDTADVHTMMIGAAGCGKTAFWLYPNLEYQDEDGEYHFSNTYEFEGLDGIVLAVYHIQNGDESYTSSSVGEGICDVHSRTGGDDQGISGTIWMAKNSGEVIYYMNPIYQTADGRVYLVPGSGLHISSDVGGRASQKIEEKVTATENGEAYSYTFSAEVFIDFADPAETVTILQMNKQDEEVKRETFLADNLPKQFVPGDKLYTKSFPFRGEVDK